VRSITTARTRAAHRTNLTANGHSRAEGLRPGRGRRDAPRVGPPTLRPGDRRRRPTKAAGHAGCSPDGSMDILFASIPGLISVGLLVATLRLGRSAKAPPR